MKFDFVLQLARKQGFALDVSWQGETHALALVGPSGSGKSTALGLLAGLEKHAGHVRFDGEDQGPRALHQRRVGYVTQEDLLFPHLSVAQNLQFSPHARQDLTRDVIDALHLGALLQRMPRNLSGGERRRVSLGRALVSAPRLLLLDEPFAGLDAQRRRDALSIVRAVQERFGTPVILVSHVADEIVGVAEIALRLEQGRVVSSGSAVSVLRAGETRVDNHLTGRVLSHNEVDVEGCVLAAALSAGDAGVVRLACFAHDVLLATERPRALSARNILETEVTRVERAGDAALVHLARPRLVATLTHDAVRELGIVPGRRVFALIKATSVSCLGPA